MGPRVATPLSISATPRRPAPLLGLQGPAASGCLHACATSSTDQGAYGLVGREELIDAGTWPKASVAEPLRDQLPQLCRQRLDAFRMQRGEEVGCLLTQKPAASGTGAATARRSAARSKSGCSPAPKDAANAAGRAVARQTPHQRALEVDQIVPRNQGGSDDLSNLQALCFRCNAGKRWKARGGLWVLRVGGQRPGAAGERIGSYASPMPIR